MTETAKTLMLLAALGGLLVLAGWAAAGIPGAVLALILAAAALSTVYFKADHWALRASGAEPLEPGAHPRLQLALERLSVRAGVPTPRLYRIPSAACNAFSVGRDPSRAVIALTDGLLARLPQRELEGVLAHELSHIRYRDSLTVSVVVALALALTGVAAWTAWIGGDEDQDAPGPLFLLLAPLAALLVQLGISREREYAADADAARLTADPEGLARALELLGRADGTRAPYTRRPATASLYIVAPACTPRALRWFSTHPPLEERVTRLRRMALGGYPQL
ncbi:heat shock protein HtpX [Deinobacterium chartae]|uniref:Heat shock protein HtpX n=1 Tax=Deinobacterium chartae TaxID=521158 RepID=A0A841I670_9DEIO|nr:M48 family metalloprotease [Deinobacterium chartae]MBB6099920.1 heat shock protein HtpX [Deinobacterium chartae]